MNAKMNFNANILKNKNINIIIKNLTRPCPVCDNKVGEVLHKQLFVLPSDSPLPNELEIVFCSKCGFVYADTTANQAIYNEYYTLQSKYEDLNIASGSGTGIYDHQRLEVTSSTISKVLTNHQVSILDMGCANGGLLKVLKSLGYQDILGIDPSKKCNINVNNSGIQCIEGDIFSESFKEYPKTFDCIVLTHVLEHIYDLNTAIENISSKLNDEGILYIEVPDASRYSEYYTVPYYYIDCEHINHFDHDSIFNLITPKGFTQLETRNIEFRVSESNYYPAVYSILKKTNKGKQNEIQFSDISEKSFLKFLEQSYSNDENEKIIQKLANNQEPIVIWGAGQFTLRLLSNSSLTKCNIHGFIDSDSNKQGKELLNYLIYSPDYIKDKNTSILICSALNSFDIISSIKEINNNSTIYVMK